MSPQSGQPRRLLLYEPQVEGHHLVYLRHITETLLTAGFRLTLALDRRPQSQPRVEERLGDLLALVTVIPARDETGWFGGCGKADTVAACQKQSGAEDVFVCCLDEIASHSLRRAAFGLMPPASLRGNLGGIYLRPRFLTGGHFSPNQLLKKRGFARLLRDGWFRRVLFLDEYLRADIKKKLPGAPFYFLPEPCPEFHGPDKSRAREFLSLPPRARIFLFYGGPYERKGLDLAVAAMLGLPPSSPAFLFCVGPQPSDPAIAQGLETLVRAQRAHSINRFILAPEEELCFAACDAVLLPYRKHFGSSAVLSRRRRRQTRDRLGRGTHRPPRPRPQPRSAISIGKRGRIAPPHRTNCKPARRRAGSMVAIRKEVFPILFAGSLPRRVVAGVWRFYLSLSSLAMSGAQGGDQSTGYFR